MVKAGKFTKRGLGFKAVYPTLAASGRGLRQVDGVSKKFWIGQLILKRGRRATACTIRLRGPTWGGLTRIDYCEVWAHLPGTATRAVGAGWGAGVGTVMSWASTRIMTVFAGASLNATAGQPIYGLIYGA